MTRDLNDDPTNRPEARDDRSRRWLVARVAAVVGLAAAVLMAVVAPAVAGPSPTQAGSFNDCVNEAVARITVEASRLPAAQRSAYISTEVAKAQARCGAILSSSIAPTTTTSSPTSTSTTTTTTTTTSTTTTSPTSTTTSTAPGRYEVTVTGVIGTGPQTLTANCNAGDRLVSYRYVVGNPTGNVVSRRVSVNSTSGGVTLTYEVIGTVADPRTSLTAVCRTA